MRVQLTADAEADLLAILRHIGEDNPTAAMAVVETIEARLRILQQQPSIGRRSRVRGTRELVFAPLPYLAIYQVKAGAELVSVLRVLHGAQQWPPA